MDMLRLDHQTVMHYLPDRLPDSHKGNYGKILLLCGSVGFTGAAALAAMGALRCGAGLVYLGVPGEIYDIEAVKLTEPIVFPLPGEDGKLSAAAIEPIKEKLDQMDAILIGCGLGQSDGVFQVVKYILEHFNGPVVLDADGINVLHGHKDILRGRSAPTVMTPHMGEYIRFCSDGKKVDNSHVCDLANDLGVIVVLKGHHTIITDGNILYQNHTGNPGLATGGSGDVLAGMIVSLLGQKLSPPVAAACGVWLHGAAADICAGEIGQYGMIPSDLLKVIPRLLK